MLCGWFGGPDAVEAVEVGSHAAGSGAVDLDRGAGELTGVAHGQGVQRGLWPGQPPLLAELLEPGRTGARDFEPDLEAEP